MTWWQSIKYVSKIFGFLLLGIFSLFLIIGGYILAVDTHPVATILSIIILLFVTCVLMVKFRFLNGN